MKTELEIQKLADETYPIIDSLAHSKANEHNLWRQEAYVKCFLACQQMLEVEIQDQEMLMLNIENKQKALDRVVIERNKLQSDKETLLEALKEAVGHVDSTFFPQLKQRCENAIAKATNP